MLQAIQKVGFLAIDRSKVRDVVSFEESSVSSFTAAATILLFLLCHDDRQKCNVQSLVLQALSIEHGFFIVTFMLP